jgi:DnaJ-class molecular chaperone
MRGRLEEHVDHLNIWGEAGGIVWVNPSSKCASCHSNETDQRNIHTHVNVSSKAYVYDKTIYNSCARARFAGCTYLRHIILALNTVYYMFATLQQKLQPSYNRGQSKAYNRRPIVAESAALNDGLEILFSESPYELHINIIIFCYC